MQLQNNHVILDQCVWLWWDLMLTLGPLTLLTVESVESWYSGLLSNTVSGPSLRSIACLSSCYSDSFRLFGAQRRQGWHFTKLPLLKLWAAHGRYGASDLPPSSCLPQFGLNSYPGQKCIIVCRLQVSAVHRKTSKRSNIETSFQIKIIFAACRAHLVGSDYVYDTAHMYYSTHPKMYPSHQSNYENSGSFRSEKT